MPTVLRVGAYRFHFYSNENMEAPHIHVEAGEGECKFWLEPVALASNRGLTAAKVRGIERLVFDHRQFLMERYCEFHGC